MKSFKLFYKIFNTRIGKIGLIWKIEKKDTKVFGIMLPQVSISSIKKNYPGILRGKSKIIKKISMDINLYLDGKQAKFNLNNFDLSRLGKFQKRVLMVTLKIPQGSVSTYGAIAKKLGIPKGARAVGQALAKNPFPIILPCHRVIKSDGTLGGFGGNIDLKRKLLSIEKVIIQK